MRVKKRKVIITLFMLLICGLIYFSWPLSFDGSFEYVSIGYMEHGIGIDSEPTLRSEVFDFSSQDAELKQIKDVLKKYTFHRVPALPFSDASMHWEGVGQTFTLGMSNGDAISISKSPYIIYGSQVYRLGYWGNSKSVALTEELKDVLSLD